MHNLFVVALDDWGRSLLETIGAGGPYAFHPLLDAERVTHPAGGFPPFDEMLAAARARLAAFEGSVDGVIGYWDFPTSGLVPLLCRELGLPAASPEAVACCEHKYWCRLVQRAAVRDLVPPFQLVDPFAMGADRSVGLPFPFWLKPVKAHSSFLGFRVHNRRELRAALRAVRARIGLIAEPFNEFLAHVERPPPIAGIDGYHCIAEAIISGGHQCTLEGYVHHGEPCIYAAVDSIRSRRHRSSFARYQYPSALPGEVRERMAEAAQRVIRSTGYDNAAFNMEFFWSPGSDRLHLLEINTRLSKSHAPLLLLVDGASHQKVAIDLQLGRRPELPHRLGAWPLAAKFMLRTEVDGVIRRSPGPAEMAALVERFPEARARILAPTGTRLARLAFQDSYSYELAEVYLGGRSRRQLLDKGRTAARLLAFDVQRARAA